MPVRDHDRSVLLSESDVERIYRRTDELDLDRDWVIVPLNCAEQGLEMLLPDGKILLRAPGVLGFEAWLEGLASRLVELGLSRTARRSAGDPTRRLVTAHAIRLVGTRGYLASQPELNRIEAPLPTSSPPAASPESEVAPPLRERRRPLPVLPGVRAR